MVDTDVEPPSARVAESLQTQSTTSPKTGFGLADPEFANAVEGEWFGYECSFSVRGGEARSIPVRCPRRAKNPFISVQHIPANWSNVNISLPVADSISPHTRTATSQMSSVTGESRSRVSTHSRVQKSLMMGPLY